MTPEKQAAIREAVAWRILAAEPDDLRICAGPAPCVPEPQACSCTRRLLNTANAAIAAHLKALESAGYTVVPSEPNDGDIESIVKADFLHWCVYGGYTDEVKRMEWLRMKNIEVEQFRRRYSAMLTVGLR
jgi:hypothetical protein